MAFDSKGLSRLVISDDGRVVMWSYRTTDPLKDLLEDDYFNLAAGHVSAGDRILCFNQNTGEAVDFAVSYRSRQRVRVSRLALCVEK